MMQIDINQLVGAVILRLIKGGKGKPKCFIITEIGVAVVYGGVGQNQGAPNKSMKKDKFTSKISTKL